MLIFCVKYCGEHLTLHKESMCSDRDFTEIDHISQLCISQLCKVKLTRTVDWCLKEELVFIFL